MSGRSRTIDTKRVAKVYRDNFDVQTNTSTLTLTQLGKRFEVSAHTISKALADEGITYAAPAAKAGFSSRMKGKGAVKRLIQRAKENA